MHTEKYTLFLAWFAFLSAKPFMMQGETKERWMELCEQAAVVPDTIKLLTLILEINHLLEEKTQYTSLRRAQGVRLLCADKHRRAFMADDLPPRCQRFARYFG